MLFEGMEKPARILGAARPDPSGRLPGASGVPARPFRKAPLDSSEGPSKAARRTAQAIRADGPGHTGGQSRPYGRTAQAIRGGRRKPREGPSQLSGRPGRKPPPRFPSAPSPLGLVDENLQTGPLFLTYIMGRRGAARPCVKSISGGHWICLPLRQ